MADVIFYVGSRRAGRIDSKHEACCACNGHDQVVFFGEGVRVVSHNYADTGFGSADLREPRAARTKLFPNSHIGPGNLRHSVSTSSSALTNMSISRSPMINGGRIFITSMAWPATCVRMRCLLSIWVTTIWAKSTLSILCNSFHAIFSLNSCGS